jgi:glycosyltransferase involved in cell wall biosynthesis
LVLAFLTLGDPRRLTGGHLYNSRIAQAAPRHGATMRFVAVPDRLVPTAALAAPRMVARALALRPAALLVDSIVAALVAPRLAVRPPPVPTIAVVHQSPGGVGHGAMRTAAAASLDGLLYRRADLVVAVSALVADELTRHGVGADRVHVVPPGRDLPPPQGPPPELRRGRRAALLCVANWAGHKGIVELLDAFARLPRDAATLHLAGDQDGSPAYAARVRRRLSRPELHDRVVVHGRVPPPLLAGLYAAADVFVLPATRETYGTVFAEAMAFGLPVVGWRKGNLPHLATDGREALLVTPGDVPGLAGALAALTGDEALRRRLGAAARERALSHRTWEQSAAAFFAAVRSVVPPGGIGSQVTVAGAHR